MRFKISAGCFKRWGSANDLEKIIPESGSSNTETVQAEDCAEKGIARLLMLEDRKRNKISNIPCVVISCFKIHIVIVVKVHNIWRQVTSMTLCGYHVNMINIYTEKTATTFWKQLAFIFMETYVQLLSKIQQFACRKWWHALSLLGCHDSDWSRMSGVSCADEQR